MKFIVRAVILVLAMSGMGLAADLKSGFDSLYGERAKNLSVKDAADFVTQLLKDAANLKDDRSMAAYLVERAMDYFPLIPTGNERNNTGEALLTEQMAFGEKQYRDGNISYAVKFFQQAGDVASKIASKRRPQAQLLLAAAQSALDAEKKASQMEGLLAAKPGDPNAASALARLYLVELGKPSLALKWAAAAGDEKLKSFCKFAQAAPQEIPVPACLELAEWYRQQGARASLIGKGVAYASAKRHFEQFLAGHSEQDTDALLAQKGIDEASKELAKLPSICLPADMVLSPSARPRVPNKEDGDTVRSGGLAGTWELALPEGLATASAKDYVSFKPGRLVDRVRIVYPLDGNEPGDANRMPARIIVETAPLEVAGGKAIIRLGPTATCLFNLPLAVPAAKGKASLSGGEANATEEASLAKLEDNRPAAILAHVLAEGRLRTKSVNIWTEADVNKLPQGERTWMFCDSGVAIMQEKTDRGGGRRSALYVVGKWRVDESVLRIETDSAERVFPYPLVSSGTIGKKKETRQGASATEVPETQVRLFVPSSSDD